MTMTRRARLTTTMRNQNKFKRRLLGVVLTLSIGLSGVLYGCCHRRGLDGRGKMSDPLDKADRKVLPAAPPGPKTKPEPNGFIRRDFFPAQTYSELLEEIKAKGSRFVLPDDDFKNFDPGFPLGSPVLGFLRGGHALGEVMAIIENTCRSLANLPPPKPADPISVVDVARHLRNFLSASSQMAGWMHVEKYIIAGPEDYKSATAHPCKCHDPARELRGFVQSDGPVGELMGKGATLLRRVLMRISWVLRLQALEHKSADPEVYLRVISADRLWTRDATAFMKEAETKVMDVLRANPERFQAFRDLQKKGVAWPHAAIVRRDIENAGFAFRPMMVKRDRCVCATCEVEVSGWRPWHNPWAFHDYAKHHPEFLDVARTACAGDRATLLVLEEWRASLPPPLAAAPAAVPVPAAAAAALLRAAAPAAASPALPPPSDAIVRI